MTIIRVIDLETCGLEPDRGVCEIAAVDVSRGGIVNEWRSFVHPGRPIPPEMSAIHHIVDEDVADAPPLTDADEDVRYTARRHLEGSVR